MAESTPEDPAQRYARLWIRTFYILGNLILVFLGMGGLAVSIISKINMFGDLTLLDYYQNVNVNVFLAASTVLIMIGCLGIFAGSKSCYKSTLAHGALLGSFLVSTTVYTVTMGVLTDYTRNGGLYQQMRKNMNNYDKFIVDKLHTKLSCCGLNDITTWNLNEIPASCCPYNEIKCALGSPYLQTNGCFKEFIRTSRYYAWLIFSVLITVGLLEIFAIMLSSVQCHIIKDRSQKKRAKLEKEGLKIPRPQVHVENETQDGEKENEKEEKNEKEGKNEKEEKKQDKEVKKKKKKKYEKEKEIEKRDKEGKEEKKEEKEEKKEEDENKKELVKKSEETESSDIKDDVEETKQKNQANIVINLY